MQETISIRNFGGISRATIPLNSINIFIGKQASGKSVAAKLIYFFSHIHETVFESLAAGEPHRKIGSEINALFLRYFPPASWPSGTFSITYRTPSVDATGFTGPVEIPSMKVSVARNGRHGVRINSTSFIKHIETIRKSLLADCMHSSAPVWVKQEIKKLDGNPNHIVGGQFQVVLGRVVKAFGGQNFVPAGRSFFANVVSNLFSLLSSGETLDPFLVEFGRLYERMKRAAPPKKLTPAQNFIQTGFRDILGGRFITDNTGEFLLHKDGRKVPLLFCSSGQQEVLPLGLVLQRVYLAFAVLAPSSTTYIEEPEAHLYPSAQRRMVEMIAAGFNSAPSSRLVITTHSPYVLASFNNLLEGGAARRRGISVKRLEKVIRRYEILRPGVLSAWMFAGGTTDTLIDPSTDLIKAEALDEVSTDLAIQFDDLLDLE
jgi:hypothetical protein